MNWPSAEFIFPHGQYRWSGWFGCQLESIEWLRVPAGTQRIFCFGPGRPEITMTVWRTERLGLKVRTLWAITSKHSVDECNKDIHQLQDLLRNIV